MRSGERGSGITVLAARDDDDDDDDDVDLRLGLLKIIISYWNPYNCVQINDNY